MDLSPRREKILALIIDRYINTGDPVGSKILVDAFETPISSATIRNEMAVLTRLGFIAQPYTSSGRVPSAFGLRYYLDNLMRDCCLSESDKYSIRSRTDVFEGDPVRIVSGAVRILSDFTGRAAAGTTPLDGTETITRAEMIPSSGSSALVLLGTSGGLYRTRLCRLDREPDVSAARLFYSLVRSYVIGKRPSEITTALIQSAASSVNREALFMTPLLAAVKDLATEMAVSAVTFEGRSLLPGGENVSGADGGTSVFDDPARMRELLTADKGKKATVRIGADTPYPELAGMSVVIAPYSIGDRRAGSVAVLAPVRSDYQRLIPVTVYVAELISGQLTDAVSPGAAT